MVHVNFMEHGNNENNKKNILQLIERPHTKVEI